MAPRHNDNFSTTARHTSTPGRRLMLGWALLLAGCAQTGLSPTARQDTGPVPVHTGGSATAETEPPATRGLALSGRLSILSPHRSSQRLQGSQASFELRGTVEHGSLELATPMGSLVARARWQPGSVLVQTSDSERAFDSLDDMAAELLGESVPMAALFDWLQARPWPGAPHAPLLAPQQGFEQLGWHVDLSRASSGLFVAKRLQPPELTLRVRLDAADASTP